MAERVDLRDRMRIVGCGFVHKEGRVLILKRTAKTGIYPALWTVPAGGVEEADYLRNPKDADGWEGVIERATRREIREEAGVEVGKLSYLSNFVFLRPNDGIPVLGIRYLAAYESGKVTLDPNDATNFAWVSESDILDFEFLGNIPAVLRKIFSSNLL